MFCKNMRNEQLPLTSLRRLNLLMSTAMSSSAYANPALRVAFKFQMLKSVPLAGSF